MYEGFIGRKYVADEQVLPGPNEEFKRANITISRISSEKKEPVGSYQRNYGTFFQTFFPFICNGKELALYSSEYMYTRVMQLPDCRDIGGEDGSNTDYENHFCPVQFYVPFYRKITLLRRLGESKIESWLVGEECFDPGYSQDELGPVQYCDFGFVAGCKWGDDSTMKIQLLDLSRADEGIIKRDQRFGMIHLPDEMSLDKAIDMDGWQPGFSQFRITHTTSVDYKKSRPILSRR